MKLKCGPDWDEVRAAREKWHCWFAWFPVRVGNRDCRWLETVERKGTFHAFPGDDHWSWEYRAEAQMIRERAGEEVGE